MPTFENPAVDADEVQTALRALAHATRSIDDPRQIYSMLGSLTSAVASLSQSLHQIAAFHDGPAKSGGWVPAESTQARSTAYRVSWELHRAGEVLHQVSESINSAHEAEAVLRYHREFPDHGARQSAAVDHGLSL
ncbi:MAG: hypothetical protein QM638_15315 [Nocardioides sp.]|uniref:hypothetical protein n=1 Tax=Nocardioides sp. TaxID=35761 RepID=UPI0039E58793